MKTFKIFLILCLVIGFYEINGQSFHGYSLKPKDIVKTAEKTVKQTVKIAKNSGDVLYNGYKSAGKAVINTGGVLIGQKKPEDIIKPFKSIPTSLSKVASEAGALSVFVTDPSNKFLESAQQFSRKVGGKNGEFLFNLGTFTTQFYNALLPASLYSLANVLKKENPFIVTAIPLAAAIRSAYETHKSKALPIPDDVKTGLANYFSKEILNKAKYSVGTVEITLPNLIGQVQNFMGNSYAVVVGDIIVFNAVPPSFDKGMFYWAHEMTHVKQYNELSVDGFAYEYLRDGGETLESEADALAYKVIDDDMKKGDNNSSGNIYSSLRLVKTSRKAFKTDNFRILARLDLYKDTTGLQFAVNSLNDIIAIDILSGNVSKVSKKFTSTIEGASWDFKFSKTWLTVMPNGDIIFVQNRKMPFGNNDVYHAIKVGELKLI